MILTNLFMIFKDNYDCVGQISRFSKSEILEITVICPYLGSIMKNKLIKYRNTLSTDDKQCKWLP